MHETECIFNMIGWIYKYESIIWRAG